MRGTLSHPIRTLAIGRQTDREPESKTAARAHAYGWRSLPLDACLAACVALAATVACNQVDTDPGSQPHGAKAKSAAVDTDLPFVWPEDPSHPVLEISIDAPDAQGTIQIELMPELAPATVVDVIELANEGFYDGTTFHRVIPGFMIQGGDPNSRDRDPSNDGNGAPGRPLKDEFGRAPFVRGVVGMGNKGREGSTSTQFFIMHADNGSLDGRYTAVGRVLSGMQLVDDIMTVPIDRTGRWGPKDRPIENVVMSRVRTIGQVAAIKAATALEETAVKNSIIAAASADSMEGGAATAGPPAALDSANDWERLEAMGR